MTIHTLKNASSAFVVDTLYRNLDTEDLNIAYFKEIINIKLTELEIPEKLCQHLSQNFNNPYICEAVDFNNQYTHLDKTNTPYTLLRYKYSTPTRNQHFMAPHFDDTIEYKSKSTASDMSYVLLKDRKRNLISEFNIGDIAKVGLTVTQLDITNTEIINAIFNESKYIIYDIYSCYEIIKYLINIKKIDDVLRESLITTLNKYAKVYPEYCKLIDKENGYLKRYHYYSSKRRYLQNKYYEFELKCTNEDVTNYILEYLYVPHGEENPFTDAVVDKIKEKLQEIESCSASLNSNVTIRLCASKKGFFDKPTYKLIDVKHTIHEYIEIYAQRIYAIRNITTNIKAATYIIRNFRTFDLNKI
jgi:hypothetical protein